MASFVLCTFWLLYTVICFLLGAIYGFNFSLPQIIRDLLLFGKAKSNKRKWTIVQWLEIPKRYEYRVLSLKSRVKWKQLNIVIDKWWLNQWLLNLVRNLQCNIMLNILHSTVLTCDICVVRTHFIYFDLKSKRTAILVPTMTMFNDCLLYVGKYSRFVMSILYVLNVKGGHCWVLRATAIQPIAVLGRIP